MYSKSLLTHVLTSTVFWKILMLTLLIHTNFLNDGMFILEFRQMFLEHLVCNRRVLSPVENEKVNWTERRAPKPHYLMRQGERGKRVPLSNRCSRPCISLSPSSSLAQATWKDGPKTSCNKRQVIVPNRAERGSNTEDGTEKERHWEAVHGALPGPGGQSDPS